MPESLNRAELERLIETVAEEGAPSCPRCDTPMDARPVPPRDDVSYVRDRIWLTCPACHASAVVDRDHR